MEDNEIKRPPQGGSEGATAAAGEDSWSSEEPVQEVELSEVAEEAVKVVQDILRFFPRVPSPKVSSRIENDGVWVEIEGDPSGRLIGRKGQTIDAFQHVLSKIISHRFRQKVTVHVDAEHYKKRHLEKLTKLAAQTADYVAQTNGARALEPMSAADRRMVHITLRERQDVTTASEGRDPNRFVVIWPKRGD